MRDSLVVQISFFRDIQGLSMLTEQYIQVAEMTLFVSEGNV